mmetsp:Transcript_30422/g.40169  ORF Transcript_30422/g.40169 Transcript_30422/m.40169 type:complete len:211 (-) Transcript_30422:1119-1751(-)
MAASSSSNRHPWCVGVVWGGACDPKPHYSAAAPEHAPWSMAAVSTQTKRCPKRPTWCAGASSYPEDRRCRVDHLQHGIGCIECHTWNSWGCQFQALPLRRPALPPAPGAPDLPLSWALALKHPTPRRYSEDAGTPGSSAVCSAAWVAAVAGAVAALPSPARGVVAVAPVPALAHAPFAGPSPVGVLAAECGATPACAFPSPAWLSPPPCA